MEKENIDKIENEKKAALSNVSSAEKKVEQCKQQTQVCPPAFVSKHELYSNLINFN